MKNLHPGERRGIYMLIIMLFLVGLIHLMIETGNVAPWSPIGQHIAETEPTFGPS